MLTGGIYAIYFKLQKYIQFAANVFFFPFAKYFVYVKDKSKGN